MAEVEGLRFGERIKAAHQERRLAGKKTNGTTAIGWRAKRKRMLPNHEERSIGRIILKLRRRGLTFVTIAAELNRRRIPTRPIHCRRGPSRRMPWSETTVARWHWAAEHGFPITGYWGNYTRSRFRPRDGLHQSAELHRARRK